MSNMGYCRFYNTLEDLQDCYDNMEISGNASEEERMIRKRLILLCKDIADDYYYKGVNKCIG